MLRGRLRGDGPLAEIQGDGRLLFDRATRHKRRLWSSPPAKDSVLATFTDPFREKIDGGAGFAGFERPPI